MKHAIWGYLIIALGLVIISIMMLINNLTITNEEDYYLAKEIMESSMRDAVDEASYRTSGEVVMSREKFVEVFLRRFAESITPNKDYQLDFYQIYEYPPAATVRIRSTTGVTNVKGNAINVDVDTLISAILVTGYDITSDNFKDKILFNKGDSIPEDQIFSFRKGAINAYLNSKGRKVSGDEKKYDLNDDDILTLEDLAIMDIIVYGGYKIGDINRDGVVDIKDVNMCRSPQALSNREILLADVNNSMDFMNEKYYNNNRTDRSLDCKEIEKYVNGKRGSMGEIAIGDVNTDGVVNAIDAYSLKMLIDKEGKKVEEKNKSGNSYRAFESTSEKRLRTFNTSNSNSSNIVPNDNDVDAILDYIIGERKDPNSVYINSAY